MDKYKVSYFSDVGKIEYKELKKRTPNAHQVLVKVEACAICTLEQRVYKGLMKYYPFSGGHEVAGSVEAVGEEVKGVKIGDRVAIRLLNSCGECYYCRNGHENQCLVSFIAKNHEGIYGPGGFAQYMLVEAKDVYKTADDLDYKHAALSEPLACCVHSVKNGMIELGDDVVVIGAGIMGAFHIQLAKLKGARVIALEVDERRLKIAKKLGADITVNTKDIDAVAKVKELTEGRGADVIFSTVSKAKVAEEAVMMAGKLGRVIFYSSIHPDEPITISPNKIHSGEQIITGTVNPNKSDFLIATKLLSNKTVKVENLISGEYGLDDLKEACEKAIMPDTYRIIIRP